MLNFNDVLDSIYVFFSHKNSNYLKHIANQIFSSERDIFFKKINRFWWFGYHQQNIENQIPNHQFIKGLDLFYSVAKSKIYKNKKSTSSAPCSIWSSTFLNDSRLGLNDVKINSLPDVKLFEFTHWINVTTIPLLYSHFDFNSETQRSEKCDKFILHYVFSLFHFKY